MKHATNILLTDLPDSLRQPCSLKGPYVSRLLYHRTARPHNATMSWLMMGNDTCLLSFFVASVGRKVYDSCFSKTTHMPFGSKREKRKRKKKKKGRGCKKLKRGGVPNNQKLKKHLQLETRLHFPDITPKTIVNCDGHKTVAPRPAYLP